MKRILISMIVALAVASGANAASLTVDTDKANYVFGETIVVTVTLDTLVAPPVGQIVDVTLNWDGALASAGGAGPFGSSTQVITDSPNALPSVGGAVLTSFNGAVQWSGAANPACVSLGAGAGNTCIILDQINFAGAFPVDPSVLVGTLDLVAGNTPGALNLNLSSLNAFGLSPILGSNFQNAVVVPEPTTAALLGLGLLGLSIAGRRRS